jgi:hypothetical protein
MDLSLLPRYTATTLDRKASSFGSQVGGWHRYILGKTFRKLAYLNLLSKQLVQMKNPVNKSHLELVLPSPLPANIWSKSHAHTQKADFMIRNKIIKKTPSKCHKRSAWRRRKRGKEEERCGKSIKK